VLNNIIIVQRFFFNLHIVLSKIISYFTEKKKSDFIYHLCIMYII